MLRFKKATMISSADDFIAGDTSATTSSARISSSSSSSTLTFMAPTSSVHADPISTAEQQQHEPRRISQATTIQAPSDSSISSVEESSTSNNIFSVAVRVPSIKIRSVVGESKNSSPGAQKAFQIQKSESLIRSYTKAPIATVPTTILNNNDAANNNNKKRAASVVISDSSDSSTASSPLLEDSTPPRQDVQTASSNKRQRIDSSAPSSSNLASLSSSGANNIQHHQPQQPHHHPSQPTIRLLATPQDTCHLNALHCFVRRNIEVFQATSEDVAAPSPGRKNRVMIGQVGLRCVHCRPSPGPTTGDTTPGTNTGAKNETDDDDNDNDNDDDDNNNKKRRVKRAVCYPSSISRVYTSVSDMKFDHFAHCPYLPPEVREEFDRLRKEYRRRSAGSGRDKSSSDSSVASSSSSYSASSSSSSSSRSTASYYYDSAVEVGMVDMDGGGIGLVPSCAGIGAVPAAASAAASAAAAASYDVKNATKSKSATPDNVHRVPSKVDVRARAPSVAATINDAAAATASKTTAKASLRPLAPAPTLRLEAAQAPAAHISHIKLSQQQAESHASLPSSSSNSQRSSMISGNNSKDNNNMIFLAAEEDEQVLNPIHCFVRRNVEVFAATREDIAAPAPGRKNRVVVGQVGIRCVHCAHLAPRDRVKRAVCFPPNVSGIYHSVSNMKFDHFAACRGLSPEARTEFQGLRAACGRRGGRSTTSSSRKSRGSTSSSTAQYYHDSALNLGLVDTQDGIRFRPDQAACLRAAAALTVAHAHHHQPPPPLPPSLEHRQGQYRQQAQQRVEAHALPTAQPLPSLGHGEMIGDGMSALIFAAAKRAAENEAQLTLADTCTNKLAV